MTSALDLEMVMSVHVRQPELCLVCSLDNDLFRDASWMYKRLGGCILSGSVFGETFWDLTQSGILEGFLFLNLIEGHSICCYLALTLLQANSRGF